MGLSLKRFFENEKKNNDNVNSLTDIAHSSFSDIAFPKLVESDITALVDAINTRIIQKCADDGIVFPPNFKPVERFEVSDNAELYWDTTGQEQSFLLENLDVVMNLPLAFFHPDYPGNPYLEFDKTRYIEGTIQEVLGTYDYQMKKSGACLSNGKKIELQSQNSELKVNAPAALMKHFVCFERLSDKDYTLVEPDEYYSFAPVLDIDLSGRPTIKLFYEIKDNLDNKTLNQLASQALRSLDHHSDIYAVICEPITIEMIRPDFEKSNASHAVSVKNAHYQASPTPCGPKRINI